MAASSGAPLTSMAAEASPGHLRAGADANINNVPAGKWTGAKSAASRVHATFAILNTLGHWRGDTSWATALVRAILVCLIQCLIKVNIH